MITFHSRQSDCARRVRKNENAGTVNFTAQITSPLCTVMRMKHVKPDIAIFESQRSRTAVSYRFMAGQALPLVRTRILRLAKSSPKLARSPARRSRDSRETSGKKFGEISRVISAQRPGNGRTVANAMLPKVRPDGSQDNPPCAGFGRAMSAPETCETTRNMSAQRQMQRLTSSSSDFSPSVLTKTSKNYEHTNYTNARS
jgi:hypothetical protein